MNELPQRDVLEFLASPKSSGGLPVKRIDTHAASVFLSGSRALKVKRAVKFPFLDYSTLALRKRACLAEIEVNRRFAPELYEGLARITRESDGSLRVGGDGEVVEWAVKMQRFDDSLTLDRYVRENRIDPAMGEKIAQRLAEVHTIVPKQNAAAWIAALTRFPGEHNEVFRRHPELFPVERTAELLRLSEVQCRRNTPLIEARAKAGLLVRGHGDLHLGNIALIKGEPVIFDAVEFDPVIASGDVLYDLAFLLMDLWIHEQRDAANAALNGYFEASRGRAGLEGLALLPLFLSVRSSIRAVVATARFEQSGKSEDADAAKRQFDHALAFIAPPTAQLIVIGGLSGTGKSVLAKHLAPHISPAPGALVLRSDVKRKELSGVKATVRLSASSYTREMSEKVYAALFADAAVALKAGHAVILDAVFSSGHERAAAERLAKEAGLPFQGIFLHVSLAERIRRVEKRAGDASDADRAVVLAQENYPIGETGWTAIDSSSDPDSTLTAALKTLQKSAP